MKRRTLWINLALGAALLLALVILLVTLLPGPGPAPGRTVTATIGTVTATVTANGTVERGGTVQLAFPTTGIVTEVPVAVGDEVRSGQVLARIDDSTAQQQLASARSSLVQAMSGATGASQTTQAAQQSLGDAADLAEETNKRNDQAVIQARANLQAAQDTWAETCLNVDDTTCPNPAAQEQLRAAENAVTSGRLRYDNAVATAVQNEIGYNLNVNHQRVLAERAQSFESTQCGTYGAGSSQCQSASSSLVSAQQSYETALNSRTAGLLADKQAVMTASMQLSDAQVALRRTQVELRKAQTDAVRTAKQNLTNAQQAYQIGLITGQQSITQARSNLTAAQEATTEIDLGDGTELSVSQASIDAAQALVAAAQQGVTDTTIIAPFDGVVGSISYVVGESAANGAGAPSGVTLLPTGPLEVLALFAEADAARVQVGDPVTVTFAALAGASNAGTVVEVDEVATTGTNDLVTYGVRVVLEQAPSGIREGMTASVTVTVEEVTEVLFLPPGVVTETDTGASVQRQRPDGSTEEVTVTLGLKGDLGTEITSGLSPGDVIVVPEAEDAGGQGPQGGIPGEPG